ncbi:DUF4385 domain-containing protein [Mucilaginibacter jinjuensis]|uniref:DUF4385 domain-containing protein n=1 Tax=Mucilaginibacter jinjuensis TaxID=1176721 RepID=A0ABY7TAI3_9SPHI|nr:DUF4385 domain-containing protein [Mucilaginibacter jinjuensis]WCT13441.1 DUF4385 domain-containing protein [Mucilaginibacter jinjuensis]
MKLFKPSYIDFDIASYSWKPDIDYREHPELYRVGKGEQGVLICEPYKSEISQHWRFKTPAIAEASSKKILELFRCYLKVNDFVGADMARKYLQMGYTRARRYANYKGGKKYDKDKGYQQMERYTGDPEKAESARIFYARWKTAEANELYSQLKKDWKQERG